MDETEAGSDKLMPYLHHFKNVVFVDVDQSDVTDEGLSQLAALPKLVTLHAFLAPVTGTSF